MYDLSYLLSTPTRRPRARPETSAFEETKENFDHASPRKHAPSTSTQELEMQTRGSLPGTGTPSGPQLITPGQPPTTTPPILRLVPFPVIPTTPTTISTQAQPPTGATQPSSGPVEATLEQATSSVLPSGNPTRQVISTSPPTEPEPGQSANAGQDSGSSIEVVIEVVNSIADTTVQAEAPHQPA